MSTMLMVSCRRIWSATEFSNANEIRLHRFASSTGQVVAHDEFLREVQSKRLHGLHPRLQQRGAGRHRFVQRHRPPDAPARLSWRSGGGVRRAGRVRVARRRRRGLFHSPGNGLAESASRFSTLLAALRGVRATIDLNTHSLGAHVAFEALREGTPRIVRNSWNFASAVDNESIELGERYHDASGRCQSFYVFHSRNDSVLRVWYRVGDLFDFDNALGFQDPKIQATSSGILRTYAWSTVRTSCSHTGATGRLGRCGHSCRSVCRIPRTNNSSHCPGRPRR